MFIDILQYFSNGQNNVVVSRCDYCGTLWALTKDEIFEYTNQKTNHKINGYVCPNCNSHLIVMMPENNLEAATEEEEEEAEYE